MYFSCKTKLIASSDTPEKQPFSFAYFSLEGTKNIKGLYLIIPQAHFLYNKPVPLNFFLIGPIF